MALNVAEVVEVVVDVLRNAADPAPFAHFVVAVLNRDSDVVGIKMLENFCVHCCVFLDFAEEVAAHRSQHLQQIAMQEAIHRAQAAHAGGRGGGRGRGGVGRGV